jgi:2-hydroxy-3-oxopropionate reductase
MRADHLNKDATRKSWVALGYKMMKVGFIGLGVQGKHLAINLAKAGYDLMAYDLRPEPLDEVCTHGAKRAASNKEIGAHGEVICVCVVDGQQTTDVMLGTNGVLEAARPGAIIVVHGTIDPATLAMLAEAARSRDVELVDAPVSGSEAGAMAKTMSYMVGASKDGFEKCRPVFETSGKNIIHTGEAGSGIRAKLAHQLIICVNLLAASEGMRLGTEAGLSPEIMERVIGSGGAQSRVAERWFRLKLGAHARKIFYKDLKLCLDLANELNVPIPGAALAQQLLEKIVP